MDVGAVLDSQTGWDTDETEINYAGQWSQKGYKGKGKTGKGNDNGPRCYGCQGFGHLSSECPTIHRGKGTKAAVNSGKSSSSPVNSKGKGKGGKQMRCYNCDGIGHRQFECPFPRTNKTLGITEDHAEADDGTGHELNDQGAAPEPLICYGLFPDSNPTGNTLPWLETRSSSAEREKCEHGLHGADQPMIGSINALQDDEGVQNKKGLIRIRSIVDSGCARSVCPPTHAAQFPVVETKESRDRVGFRTATGKRVEARGGKVVRGETSEGKQMSMRYTVAPVRLALDSVSQICDAGATVTFRRDGGTITEADGTTSEFGRVDNTYIRDTWVTPFGRPSTSSS